MSYYIRVFGTSLADIPLQKLQECAAPAVIQVEEGSGESWQQLVLKHDGGPEIAAIEKNPVDDGEIGADELNEFLEEVPLYWPDSAAAWLQSYLPNVKVIYAFQLLSGTDVKDGWTPLHRIYDCIWKIAGGILQADREGFSNEQGYTILWQFGKTAKGPWKVGLPVNGSGVHFQIDLGNAQHREAFMDGRIPDGVKLL